MKNQYNNNNLNHRRNFIDASGTVAINSYGEVFIIGAEVGHEDKNAPNARIESFDVDKESNEVIAFTDKGYCHIDFMYNLLSDTGLVEVKDEQKSECKRSDIWNKIYSIINKLKIKSSNDGDQYDKPSCATDIEELFNNELNNRKNDK